MRVAIFGCVILLPASSIRQRAAATDAHHGAYPRLALGVGSLTLPPNMPAFMQDDGWLRRAAEPFIVFRSARSGDRHS